ncbi:hypothetical protein [Bradyrhizobium sp. 35]|uniref:hypothetical protein n=1 Tax=Bradyrhizobium sp. 35 TaxID=2782670 RepID=UPI001FFA0C7F|nr:hypothetical protein [Bradyrhizobium sp. 35]
MASARFAMIENGLGFQLVPWSPSLEREWPRERVALINGCMIMLGALGAVTATAPAEALLNWIGWRGLFEVLAASSASAAASIYFLVPEHEATAKSPPGTVSLKTVYTDGRFWRIAPIFFNMYRVRVGPAVLVGSVLAERCGRVGSNKPCHSIARNGDSPKHWRIAAQRGRRFTAPAWQEH